MPTRKKKTTTKKKAPMDDLEFARLIADLSAGTTTTENRSEKIRVLAADDASRFTCDQVGRLIKTALFSYHRLEAARHLAPCLIDFPREKQQLLRCLEAFELEDVEAVVVEARAGRSDERFAAAAESVAEKNARALVDHAASFHNRSGTTFDFGGHDVTWAQCDAPVDAPGRAVHVTADDTRVPTLVADHVHKESAKGVDIVRVRVFLDPPTAGTRGGAEGGAVVYTVGQRVSGTLSLEVVTPFDVNAATLTLACEERVSVVQHAQQGRTNEVFGASEVRHAEEVVVVPAGRMSVGTKTIPFAFENPLAECPSLEYKDDDGDVVRSHAATRRWSLKFHVDVDHGGWIGNAFGRNVDVGVPLRVRAAPHDRLAYLGRDPALTHREWRLRPKTEQTWLSFTGGCFSCFSSLGVCAVTATFERTLFNITEGVVAGVLRLGLHNASKSEVRGVSCKLLQVCHCAAGQHRSRRLIAGVALPIATLPPKMPSPREESFALAVPLPSGLAASTNPYGRERDGRLELGYVLAVSLDVAGACAALSDDKELEIDMVLVDGFGSPGSRVAAGLDANGDETSSSSSSSSSDDGYECDVCGKDIEGVRWRCDVCEDFDLCHACRLAGATTGTHASDHSMTSHEVP